MSEFAGDWISIFGAVLLSALIAFGAVAGFLLRALTSLSDFRITVFTGALPVFIIAFLLYLNSFGHGAFGLAHYANWRSGIEFGIFFLVSFFGAKIGVRAFYCIVDFRRQSHSKETE